MIGSIVALITGLFVARRPGDKRRSPKWPAFRAERIKEHPYCAACGGTKDLEAHHIWPFHDFPHRELDATNIIILCDAPHRNCHYCFGHSYNWRGWNPSVREDAFVFHKRVGQSNALSNGHGWKKGNASDGD